MCRRVEVESIMEGKTGGQNRADGGRNFKKMVREVLRGKTVSERSPQVCLKQITCLLSFHEVERWRKQPVQRPWGRSMSGMFGWPWRHSIKYGVQRNMYYCMISDIIVCSKMIIFFIKMSPKDSFLTLRHHSCLILGQNINNE